MYLIVTKPCELTKTKQLQKIKNLLTHKLNNYLLNYNVIINTLNFHNNHNIIKYRTSIKWQ